jgi:hypothetical protein
MWNPLGHFSPLPKGAFTSHVYLEQSLRLSGPPKINEFYLLLLLLKLMDVTKLSINHHVPPWIHFRCP